MKQSNNPDMEPDDEIDCLWRSKLQGIASFPGSECFDREKAWERLAFRLERETRPRLRWGGFAAVLLVLVTGVIGWRYYHVPASVPPEVVRSSPEPGRSLPPFPVRAAPERRSQPQVPVPSRGTAFASKSHPQRPGTGKAEVLREKSDPPLDSLKLKRLAVTPPEVRDSPRTLSSSDGAAAPAEKALVASLPVVYYQQIMASPEEKSPPRRSAARFSVSLHPSGGPGESLVLRQRPASTPLHIHLSPKNE